MDLKEKSIEETDYDVSNRIAETINDDMLKNKHVIRTRLKKLSLNNFCRHSNVEIDFTDNSNNVKHMSCLVGPNGIVTGKQIGRAHV